MGYLGIQECEPGAHVPGTIALFDNPAQRTDEGKELKHAKGRTGHIILEPQPSGDPNDPLNWPTCRKICAMSIVSFGSILMTSTLPPLLAASAVVIAQDLHRSIGQVTQMTGYLLLVGGLTGPFINAAGRKWGKRPCFIVSSLFAFVGTLIASTTNTYEGLLVARIVQGFSISAYESLSISIIADMFFVHQRGVFVSVIAFMLGATSNFSSVICGPIAANLGWKYLFHIILAAIGIQLILIILFCPETTYRRGTLHNANHRKENEATIDHIEHRDAESFTPQPKTFFERMAIFTGVYSDETFARLFLAPFAVCLNLACCWAILAAGILVAVYVAVSYVMPQIFSYPPYNLSPSGVGYLYLGPSLGGFIASIILGYMMDAVATWATLRRNGGIYEPEFRLLLIGPCLLSGTGFMLFGHFAQAGRSYYLTAAMHGLAMFGTLFGLITTNAYVLDAYSDLANELFVAAMMVKNLLFFAFSYFVNDWTASQGPAQVFYVLGALCLTCTLSAPAVYVWGKKYRYYWHRKSTE
ncbi:major facilitator superfamily domain-containing protein [Aspergillus insuetus]